MSKPRVSLPRLAMGVWVDPSGAHQIEIAAPYGLVTMLIDIGQLAELECGIANAKAAISFAEGRDYQLRKFFPVETGR